MFYLDADNKLTAVAVDTRGSSFSFGKPAKLFDTRLFVGAGGTGVGRSYDVSADGKRFLVIKEDSSANAKPPGIVVVEHWSEELKARVPAK